ncbi:MAG: hypothetical protein QUV35_07310 [Hydrogenophaga sp.]|uniref:hypothetical protein n=1 Tax=Hydrogenophaga sp. TaxID=1904254 RepID=UPI0026237374|nr:hypothetical protein [Hydrogenophaga sp.]MDM7942420.1 hypothetical protein [Hydrogenophaga sp.]
MRGEALALLTLALMGCASSGKPPAFADTWQQALQACGLREPDIQQRLDQWSLNDPQFCARSQQFGGQLQCLSTGLAALAARQGSATPVSVLAFQSCLQPLAAGLQTGLAVTAGELTLAIQQCVRPLEGARPAPVVAPSWSRFLVAPRVPEAAAPTGLALPPLPGPAWSRCEATLQLRPGVARPAPALPLLPPRPSRGPSRGSTSLSVRQAAVF